MKLLPIEMLKRLPIHKQNPADIYDLNSFFIIDYSNEYYYESDLYFIFEDGNREIFSGLREDNSTITKEEYTENLRNNLIDYIYSEVNNLIFDKYVYLYKHTQNENGIFDLNEGLELMLNSKDLSEEEKRIIKDYKIFKYELDVDKLVKACKPLKDRYAIGESSPEDDKKFYEYREEIGNLKNNIDYTISLYQHRGNN